MPVAQQISADPVGSLEQLDPWFENSSLVTSLLDDGMHLLLKATGKDFADPGWDEARKLVACFFNERVATGYYTNRRALLEFCISNQLIPVSFSSAADSFVKSFSDQTTWHELVESDQTLNCVLQACLATNW